MDAQELSNLQEAYMEVVRNQQLDEGYKELPYERMMQQASRIKKQAPYRKRKESAKTAKKILDVAKEHRPDLVKLMPKLNLNFGKYEKRRKKRTQTEQADIYDIILSHLLDEGYAETQEAAEVMMVNMSEEWKDQILDEVADTWNPETDAPEDIKARARARLKSTTIKAPEKKKKPELGRYLPPREALASTKKEDVDLFDIVLEHLVSEGYADTNEAALVIMTNMSEEWRESIVESKWGQQPTPVAKMDKKAKELKAKFLKSKPGSPESKELMSRASQITRIRDIKTV